MKASNLMRLTMKKPEDIKLDPTDAEALRKLNDQQASNAAFAEQVRVAGERRNMELVQQGRTIWTGLAKKYDLDVQNVQYALNTEGTALVVMGAQFP